MMTEELQKYIERHISHVEENDFHSLYRDLKHSLRVELTDVLHTADIHPEEHMNTIPVVFAQNSTMISNVKLSDECVLIDREAFRNSSISSIHMNEHLHHIAYEAFAFCHNLTHVDIPDSVVNIEPDAFMDCKNLVHIKLSNSLQALESFVLCQCERLEHLVIPLSIKRIDNSPFLRCYSLTELTYEGTIAQWNAIEKHIGWNSDKQIVKVNCKNGTIEYL